MGIPVTITEGAVLSYRDVALIEPGEEGAWYPEEEMWDYVAVEGSSDGDNWELLLDPYDARYSGIWEQAYNNGQDGTEAMMLYHDIDLTTFYSIGEKAYFRFRLYADAYTTGWGWAIDDVEAVGTVSALAGADMPVDDFRLLGNYPNPFNPSTDIRFTVDRAQPVSLVIYNSLGEKVHQLLYRQSFSPGPVHEVTWNGRDENNSPVASGMYYYELKGEQNRKISKMLLLK